MIFKTSLNASFGCNICLSSLSDQVQVHPALVEVALNLLFDAFTTFHVGFSGETSRCSLQFWATLPPVIPVHSCEAHQLIHCSRASPAAAAQVRQENFVDPGIGKVFSAQGLVIAFILCELRESDS